METGAYIVPQELTAALRKAVFGDMTDAQVRAYFKRKEREAAEAAELEAREKRVAEIVAAIPEGFRHDVWRELDDEFASNAHLDE